MLPKLPRERMIVQTKVGPTEDPDEFYKEVLDSLDRLQLEHVDLLGLHGINNEEKLAWSIRPGGCFEMAQRLRREGRVRFIGFSTHGSVALINKAIAYTEPKHGEGFDYLNLHWYYIYQETTPCVRAAMARDMGIFVISPSDKGGKLYHPSALLHELCTPLHPITFNDLYCLMQNTVHTLSIGAAGPSDFEEHLDALPLMENAPDLLEPILRRLQRRYEDLIEPEWRDPWNLGLPHFNDLPGQINVGRIVQLRNLVKAFDMVEYGKFRYNLLGNGGDWMPGQNASPETLNPVRRELETLFRPLPAGHRLLPILEETHALLGGEALQRLSQSED